MLKYGSFATKPSKKKVEKQEKEKQKSDSNLSNSLDFSPVEESYQKSIEELKVFSMKITLGSAHEGCCRKTY